MGKKANNTLFDVTMGSCDGAEICELVGLYLLNGSSAVIDKSSAGLGKFKKRRNNILVESLGISI